MIQDSLKYIHISDMQFKVNPKHFLKLYFLIHVSSSCQYMYTYIFPLHQDKAGGSVIYRHNIVRGCTGCLNQKQRKEGTWKKWNYRSVLSVEIEGIQGKMFILKAEDIEVREQVEKAPLLHIFFRWEMINMHGLFTQICWKGNWAEWIEHESHKHTKCYFSQIPNIISVK